MFAWQGVEKKNSVRTRQVESGRRSGRAGRAALVIAAALACLAAFGVAEAGAATLPRVHVSGQQMRDAYGRQVLLRGVNDTSLTDQYQVNPNLPTVIPLQASDYDRMQGFGFNVLRLAVNWSKLEPQRGQISQDYIQRIRNVVDNAAAHGIYTVIDMHSGGWGKDVETKPGEKCPKGLRPSHGCMGAPKRATFIDNKTTCHDDKTNKRTPAVREAWTHFWENYSAASWGKKARGIQDHLVMVWAALAKAFANDRAVAGYDLLNEAEPGYTGRFQRFYTTRFDSKAIKGTIPISGVMEIEKDFLPVVFGKDEKVCKAASPISYARKELPPFRVALLAPGDRNRGSRTTKTSSTRRISTAATSTRRPGRSVA